MLALLLAACTAAAERTPPMPAGGVEFVVVRHAEKADDGSRDPPLRADGEARARRLAERLHALPLRAVYASEYRRTEATARAVADDHGLPVLRYAAARSGAEFAAALRAAHRGDAVLVVGHSNTVPDLVAALCSCAVAPINERDYGNLYRVRIGSDGRATLTHEREPG